MIHSLRIRNEAETECFAMQLSLFMALTLGVPRGYADKLARLNLLNYPLHPARYVNYARCREGGVWDLFPKIPSPPWHDFQT